MGRPTSKREYKINPNNTDPAIQKQDKKKIKKSAIYKSKFQKQLGNAESGKYCYFDIRN